MGQENTTKEKEKKSTIINSVKSWLGLFTLVVLVMEGMLVLAMTLTPASEPIFILYPLLMFLLAMALMIAWLVDGKQKRKFDIEKIRAETDRLKAQQTIKVETKEISVDPEKSTTKELEKGNNTFTDNALQFSFTKPTGGEWQPPKFIKYADFVRDTYFSVLPDDKLEELITANSPYGKLFFNAKVINVVFGETQIIEMDENTSTEVI